MTFSVTAAEVVVSCTACVVCAAVVVAAGVLFPQEAATSSAVHNAAADIICFFTPFSFLIAVAQ
jgi:hypothetical protein